MRSNPTQKFEFGGYLIGVPTISSLRNLPIAQSRSKGDFIFVAGALGAGDGSGGVYTWLPNSTDTDDGQTTIRPFDVAISAPGRWKFSIRSSADAISTLGTRITSIEGQIADPVHGLTSLKATITDEVNARITADAAIVSEIHTIEASATALALDVDAKITTEQSVRAGADGALASRATTLEANYASQAGQISSTIARIATEETARANADGALATRTSTLETSYSTQAGQITSTIARIASEETARANADGALASRTSTLEAFAPAGNRLDNTSFEYDIAGWGQYNSLNTTAPSFGRDIAGDGWRLSGEHNISATVLAGASSGEWGFNQALGSVQAGKYYGFQALGAAHRVSQQRITVHFYNSSGTFISEMSDSTTSTSPGGQVVSNHRLFWVHGQAPSGAVTATAWLLSGPNNSGSDSYQWWHRPCFGELQNALQVTPPPYTVGRYGACITNAHARISTEETARANGDSALSTRVSTLEANATSDGSALSARIDNEQTARVNGDNANATSITNLTTTVNGHTSSLSTQSGAISSLNGKTSAYWTTTAVAGSGRAQLSIHADANGGGGVDITGDVSISGSLVVNGSIVTGKIGGGQITSNAVATSGDVFIGAGATANIIETGFMNIGDATYGSALVDVSFTLDATFAADTSALFRLYADTGGGWYEVKNLIIGAGTNSGDSFGRYFGSLKTIVTGQNARFYANVQSGAFIPYTVSRQLQVSDIILTLLGAKR